MKFIDNFIIDKVSAHITKSLDDIFNYSKQTVIENANMIGFKVRSIDDIRTLSIKDKDKLANQVSSHYDKLAAATGIFSIAGGIFTVPGFIAEITSLSLVTARSVSSIAIAYGFKPSREEGEILLAIGLSQSGEIAGIIAGKFVEDKIMKFIGRKIIQKIISKLPSTSLVGFLKFIPVAGGIVSGIFNHFTLKGINSGAKSNYRKLAKDDIYTFNKAVLNK